MAQCFFVVAFVLALGVTFMASGVFAQSDATTTPAVATTTETDGSATSTTDAAISADATSTTSSTVSIDCTMAYTANLYDTPDGHLDPGYTLDASMSDTGPGIAHMIGTQSWADCKGTDGNTYEIKLTPDAYAALGRTGAELPQESLDLSATETYTLVASSSPGVSQPPSQPSTENVTATSTPASLPDDSGTASSTNELLQVATSSTNDSMGTTDTTTPMTAESTYTASSTVDEGATTANTATTSSAD